MPKLTRVASPSAAAALRKEVVYEVTVPFDKKTERLSNAILGLTPNGDTEVEWGDKKAKTH